MTPIQVVGIGLDGAAGLVDSVRQIVKQATVLMGSPRHLSYFPDHSAEQFALSDFHAAIQKIRFYLSQPNLGHSPQVTAPTLSSPDPLIVVLTSGDPLFFGFGRLLLEELPPEQITFHPHLSAVQLAFSRIKASWQDAQIISAHGRSLEQLTHALQQGVEKIAVLTDGKNTPEAIAHLLLALDLPAQYQLWVCENLGGAGERVQPFTPEALVDQDQSNQVFAPLNVVVLLRNTRAKQFLDLSALPAIGLPDRSFLSFSDRPGLMTKREVRLLVLGELALQPQQTLWDIGAGTGSVSIEIARLSPSAKIYAIEQTAAGATLIQQNSDRFQVNNITTVYGTAPLVLDGLPTPDRIFIGGSGGNLTDILRVCATRLKPGGSIVLALATLEHLAIALNWLNEQPTQYWQHRLLQVQLSRSIPVGSLTRFTPLNPVTLLTLENNPEYSSGAQ